MNETKAKQPNETNPKLPKGMKKGAAVWLPPFKFTRKQLLLNSNHHRLKLVHLR